MNQVLCVDHNVVYVDFANSWRHEAADDVAEFILPCDVNYQDKTTFLKICACTLGEDDYYNILYAIHDPNTYNVSDEFVKDVVDHYYKLDD